MQSSALVKEALATAADAFDRYKTNHLAKEPPATDKANANAALADKMRAARRIMEEFDVKLDEASFEALMDIAIEALGHAGKKQVMHGERTLIANAIVDLRGILESHKASG